MKKPIISLLLSIPMLSYAAVQPSNCVVVYSSIDWSMRRAMIGELGIAKEDIVEDKIKLELLANNPFSSQQINQIVTKLKNARSSYVTNLGDMISMYMEGNPRNLIVKYHYFNHKNQENVFIGSAIVNDYECSVDFIKYTTLKREF